MLNYWVENGFRDNGLGDKALPQEEKLKNFRNQADRGRDNGVKVLKVLKVINDFKDFKDTFPEIV